MLRYKINVLNELKAAGITAYKIRHEKLIAESSMQRLRTGIVVHPETLDTICRLLNLQPGDIIEYVPDDIIDYVPKLSAGNEGKS